MEIRVLTRDDFSMWSEQFLNLYKLCFNGYMSEEILKWRYLDNPCRDFLVVVAIENNKVVGNCAASPLEIMENDSKYKAALAMNTMVHPEYRRKGLFVTLANKLNELVRMKGYKLIFSFPNYLSNPIYVKDLGRTVIYEIPTMILDLDNCMEKRKDTGFVNEDNTFSYKYNIETNKQKNIFIKKTSEYLKWRYANNPSSYYKNFVIKNNDEVRSYLVCKEYEDKINIVDINTSSLNDFSLLINRVIQYAKSLNKKELTTWYPIGTEEHIFLEKLRFRNGYPVTYFSAKVFDDNKANPYYDYRNWFIQQGDDNVY